MPFAKSQNITQPNTQIFKFLPLGNSVGCHSNNIQKLERRDAFLGFFIFQSTAIGKDFGFPTENDTQLDILLMYSVSGRFGMAWSTIHIP